jgi:hypothetical protein
MTARTARALEALESNIRRLRELLERPAVLAAAGTGDWDRGYHSIAELKTTLAVKLRELRDLRG